jgi:hypothetical protein
LRLPNFDQPIGELENRMTMTSSQNLQPSGLYTKDQRSRRDATAWTVVQGILAPLQFLVFLVSLFLVIRYMITGLGYDIMTLSIIAKSLLLYLIMITGAIWEKSCFWAMALCTRILLGRRGQFWRHSAA